MNDTIWTRQNPMEEVHFFLKLARAHVRNAEHWLDDGKLLNVEDQIQAAIDHLITAKQEIRKDLERI
jgi:hypothetical protein